MAASTEPIANPTEPSPRRKPVVLVPACNRMLGEHPFHIAGKKYIDAVRLAGAQPLIVPWAAEDELDALLDLADGVLLTGSPSNVHPSHFGEAVRHPELPLDEARDAWTLPLIRRVVARAMPLLGICRGAQETNVAMGGSLHQAVHELPGHQDHRPPEGAPAAQAYGPAHRVQVAAHGLLRRLLDTNEIAVNSVHGQAVNRLAPGWVVEATAPDGVIEAFALSNGPGFGLCVQWHPEWMAAQNPVSLRILQAFGRACADHRGRSRAPEPDVVPPRGSQERALP